MITFSIDATIKDTHNQSQDMINWAELVEKTDQGTILITYTIRKVSHDLELFIQQERTGIQMARGLIAWNKILQNLKQDSTQPDIKKVLSFCEQDLENWIETAAAKIGPIKTPDPDFAKHAKSRLNKLLKSQQNEANITMLATLYAVEHEDKQTTEVIEHIAQQIRLYAKTDPAFSVGIGGVATIRRIKDESNKPTGLEPHPARGEGGAAKKFLRFTSAIKKEIPSMSKQEFEAAKKHFNRPMTLIELTDYHNAQSRRAAQ